MDYKPNDRELLEKIYLLELKRMRPGDMALTLETSQKTIYRYRKYLRENPQPYTLKPEHALRESIDAMNQITREVWVTYHELTKESGPKDKISTLELLRRIESDKARLLGLGTPQISISDNRQVTNQTNNQFTFLQDVPKTELSKWLNAIERLNCSEKPPELIASAVYVQDPKNRSGSNPPPT